MAPALTKADRRADCLPVVLPFPADPENRKDKINDFTLAKFPKFTCLFNRRKHLMQKAWLRACMRNNSEISDKNRYSQFDLRKSLLNSKVRINADSKNKSWHGTNVTVAVAEKVRLKYTMNKNNSSLRNMGLARTNTSLGLHSMKRMNRITHLSNRDKGNPSNLIHESGESSPDLPDSTNSELEAPYRIVRIVQPIQGQNAEKVSSSGDLKCDTIPSSVDNITMSPVDKSSSDILVSDDTNIPLSSICPSDTAVTLNDSNLCVMLTDSKCSIQAPESHNAYAVRSPIQESSNELSPKPCNIPVRDGSNDTTVIKGESSAILHQLNPVVTSISDFKESELQDSVDCLNSISPLPSLCDVSTQDDITDITTSLDPEASSFSVASPGSPASHHSLIGSDVETGSITSSTLSADASPIPSSVDEGNEKVFITFPDSFLASASGVHKELVAPAFSDALCLTLNSDSAGSDDEMHIMRKTCCPLAEKDLSSFQERVKEQERKITVALSETEALLRKYTIQHVYNEMRTLVQHIQRKFTIPCQRQAKLSGSKPRDLVDKKAELLQNESVKNLSTAALVSLVRKLESSSNSGNLLPHLNIVTLPDSEQSRNKLTSLTFSPEECADVRVTSKVLLNGVKKLLRSADPDLTESSDDGNSDIEMDEPVETPSQKKAIWKFMMERAALASRSTLLVAKIRELENQLRNVTNYLKKVTASYGDINFEEPPASASSALSTESAGDASLQTSVKLNRSKALGRPVNGYLEHSSMNSAIHSGTTPGGSEALRLEQKLNNSFTLMDTSESCSRTRALRTSNFHKRKLLVTTGLHLTNSKLAKLSSVSCVCNCQDDMPPCVLCTGRYNCIQSVDPDSLPLLDRVSLLDPNFHPLLSLEKDIPLLVHFENILKKNEAQYQSVRPVSPIPSHRRLGFGTKPKHLTDAKSRSHNLKRYARSLLSAKYRNKKKHFRKHKLVFGKWRKLHSKSSFHSRDRFRRFSVASSGSSHDSPVPSPMSAYDD
ncbi:KAT8 regulatory NSL complex subunit 1-like protein, partial [Trichonephila inaurata madagascariensis]